MSRYIVLLIKVFLVSLIAVRCVDLYAQCNSPISLNLVSSVDVNLTPFEANCGCGGYVNCREVSIDFVDNSGVQNSCINLSVIGLPDFTPDYIEVIDPITCSEYSLNPPSFGGPPNESNYLIPFATPQTDITVLICEGSASGQTEVRLSVEQCFPCGSDPNVRILDDLMLPNLSSSGSTEVLTIDECGIVSKAELGTLDMDDDPQNEIQILSITGSDISLSNGGGTVALPSGGGDDLGSHVATTDLDLANNKLINLALPGLGTDAATKAYVDSHTDADADPINEIQTISISGNDISLSNNGGTVTVPSSGDNLGNHTATQNINAANFSITNVVSPTNASDVANKAYVDAISIDDADADPVNELQTISISGQDISLSSGGGSITLPAGADNLGNHSATVDLDLTGNKLINLASPTLSSDGANKSYVDAHTDADADPVNEIQSLSIVGNDLTLSGSNTVLLPSGVLNKLEDADQDTYVDVEVSSDSDKIEFGISGTKYFEIGLVNSTPVLSLWNSKNTVIGQGAGSVLLSGENNTIVGELAGKSITTGSRNIAFGRGALQESISTNDNVAIGFESLREFGTTGTSGANVALGNRTLRDNLTGVENTALGHSALLSNTSGIRNVAVGLSALGSNTEGNYNVALGRVAGFANTDGDNNVFVGDLSGQMANGSFNTYLGRLSGRNNLTGDSNVGVGHQAMEHATGDSNTSVGENSLRNSSGSNNVGIGSGAGENNTTGLNNTFVGDGSGFNNTVGVNNTLLGNQSGFNVTTGDRNTFVGRWSGLQNFTGECNSALGYGAGPANGQANLTNTTAIGHEARAPQSNYVRLGNTAVTSVVGNVAYSWPSDRRVKSEIAHDVAGLSFVRELQPVSYKVDYGMLANMMGEDVSSDSSDPLNVARTRLSSITQVGFIAQDVEEVIRRVGIDFQGVKSPDSADGLYSISYAEFVVPLVKAVQELDDKNSELADENQKLKDKLEQILSRLDKLEKGN
jgi:hypothetical protein